MEACTIREEWGSDKLREEENGKQAKQNKQQWHRAKKGYGMFKDNGMFTDKEFEKE